MSAKIIHLIKCISEDSFDIYSEFRRLLSMNPIKRKIQNFIRKLYLYKALENFIVFILFFGAYFLLYLLVESVFYFDSSIRTILFYLSLGVGIIWLAYKVIFPFVQSFIPKFQITKEYASVLIGESDSEINDRLLNLLQLEKLGNGDLIIESINQLEKDLFRFNFLKAINLKNLILFSKLTLVPLLFFVLLSLINFDSIIANPTERVLSFNEKFNKPLDFNITILNDSLRGVEGEEFDFIFKSNSAEQIFLYEGVDVFELSAINEIYSHKFNNPISDLSFKIGTSFDRSYSFVLNIIKRPKIKYLKLESFPPKYTGLNKIVSTNLAEVFVPVGSKVDWLLDVYSDETARFASGDYIQKFVKEDGIMKFSSTADSSFYYSVMISNEELINYIKLGYTISVIDDQYPKLKVDISDDDKFNLGVYNFRFSSSDDYGISRVGYNIIDEGKIIDTRSHYINKQKNLDKQFSVNTRDLNYSGDVYIKFFVKDNDGYNGVKTSYSLPFFIKLYSAEELSVNEKTIEDSLLHSYSDKLDRKIVSDQIEKEFERLDKNDLNDNKRLEQLKKEVEKSLEEKITLSKQLNSISDKELLEEIERAIIAQQELLKEIEDALKGLENTKKHDELDSKNQFQESKTLNFLRKVAAAELLKKLSSEAAKLNDLLKDISSETDNKYKSDVNESLNILNDNLEKYSKLKGDELLKKQLEKDIENIEEENAKESGSDVDSMQESSENILNKLQSELSTCAASGSQISIDLKELEYLFYEYLSLSYSEENLIIDFDISEGPDQVSQYSLLNTLSHLNSRLYNFALDNESFSRASFDLIYPLQGYYEKINEAYYMNNESKLNQRQRELLRDINIVTDLLSDIQEQMLNAQASAGSSGDGNKRENGTPQDLIDEQQKLNSETPGENGEQLSDEEISDIIQKQEDIKNKLRELSGENNSEFEEEVKELKKALLKHAGTKQIKNRQEKLKKLLKDFKGEAKEEEEKRKSKSANQHSGDYSIESIKQDSIFYQDEILQREVLDYNEFYNNKIEESK